jgi:hypothetical protein
LNSLVDVSHNAPSEPAEHHPARLGDHVPELGDCVGFIFAGSERFSLGELGLLENIPRTATLRAEGPAVLLHIDREVFLDIVKVRAWSLFLSL